MSSTHFFRNWSWKKFGLDTLFFMALFVLLNCVFVTFGIDEALSFTTKELLRYVAQGMVFSFIQTVWNDTKRDPLFYILLKKLK